MEEIENCLIHEDDEIEILLRRSDLGANLRSYHDIFLQEPTEKKSIWTGHLGALIFFVVLLNVKQENYTARFEVFTAVTMKNPVFWDIKSQFVIHRRHITSTLQSPAG
jgi:hypothetical protein